MSSIEIEVEDYDGKMPCYGGMWIPAPLTALLPICKRWIGCSNLSTHIVRGTSGLADVKTKLIFHSCNTCLDEIKAKARHELLP